MGLVNKDLLTWIVCWVQLSSPDDRLCRRERQVTSAFGLELPWGEQTLNPVCVCVGTVHVDMFSIYQGLLIRLVGNR